MRDLLIRDQVLMHPYLIGEIALGNLLIRAAILSDLHDLPSATMASGAEVLSYIAAARLHGTGIGYIDAHLLASVKINDAKLWTRDKRLLKQAERLKLAFTGK